VSELKLGTLEAINNLEDTVLSIKLRHDFKIADENDEQMMTASVPQYKGKGSYIIPIKDIVELYIREEDIINRLQVRKLLKKEEKVKKPLPNEPVAEKPKWGEGAPKKNKDKMPVKSNPAAIKRQVEFYFGDRNYHRDGFLKALAGKDPERWIDITEVL
jgi:hypothetical protein